jgi:isoprenylcysteine carboxyl methyltransferase (ICMT) family protein YpbQ
MIMPLWLSLFFAAALLFRIRTLVISVHHENRLKQEGAVEYGRTNSILLAIAHAAFYIAVVAEASFRGTRVDVVTYIGVALYAISVVSLLAVMHLLGSIWTVKLLIAGDHVLVTHVLFRLVRHPNYYLNILPELVGLSLVMHAFLTLTIGLPLYLIPLSNRIRQEERLMRAKFEAYG